MNDFHKELLMEVVSKWSDEQIRAYIFALVQRVKSTEETITDLKAILKKRARKQPVDTGARDGR